MRTMMRRRAGFLGTALLAVAVVLLAGCGGGTKPAAEVGSPTPSVRYAHIEVVHTTINGEARVQLRTVIEGGGEVMTAIGSDVDYGETGEFKWTSMRAALLIQLKSAMKALGWQEIGTGPAWWQVRYSGGPNAKIPVIESASPSTGPTERLTTPATGENGDIGDAAYLVSLIGKDIDDPAVAPLVRACGNVGRSLHSNIACQDKGFEVTIGSDLRIVDISLYAKDPGTYGEYAGALPLGLTWSDGYYDILDKLGTPDRRVGGSGVTINLQYPVGNVWVLLQTSATHDQPEYLRNARLMSIQITKQPQITW